MAEIVIDLNADVGEGFGVWTLGDDAALLPLLTSANVACGFHAGDPSTMMRVCARAARFGVRIGAQVGYRDLIGFGRRRLELPVDELTADLIYQLGALQACARANGEAVRYVKPHGALYNTAMIDDAQAAAVVDAVLRVDDRLPLLGQSSSRLQAEAERRGLRFVAEAFADRAYQADGRLVARGVPGAVLTDPAVVSARVVRMAREAVVGSIDGVDVPLKVESICLHGDTPGAVALGGAIRTELVGAGVRIAAFTL